MSVANRLTLAFDIWRKQKLLVRGGASSSAAHRHSGGRSLRNHLLGVYSILRQWKQPTPICLAGLFHSVYSTDHYTTTTIAPQDDSKVRRVIGAEAERLVALFCAMDRRSFISTSRNLNLRDADAVPLPIRPGVHDIKAAALTISSLEWQQLVILHFANAIEQLHGTDGSPATGWAGWKGVLRCLDPTISPIPQVCELLDRFRGGRREEEQLLELYGSAVLHRGSETSRATLERIMEEYPLFAEPLLLLSADLAKRGRTKESIEIAEKGMHYAHLWGTAWDKRLDYPTWLQIGAALRRQRRLEWVQQNLDLVTEQAQTFRQHGGRNDEARSALRLAKYLSRVYQSKLPSERGYYPGLTKKEVHDTGSFPIASILEKNFPLIREEVLRNIRSDQFHDEAEPIDRSGRWTVFMLYEAGRKHEQNCALCPFLSQLLDSNPDITDSNPMIYLSQLAPGTKVAPHRGPTNTRVRCHLGISIPQGDCGMRVGSSRLVWEEGKCIVFDDSFEHEVWNETDEPRIVLLLDLWHPDLSRLERDGLGAISWMAEQKARRLNRYRLRNELSRIGRNGEMVEQAQYREGPSPVSTNGPRQPSA